MIQRKDCNPFKLILESSKKNKAPQTPPPPWKPWCLKWGYVFLHFAFCHSPVKLGIFPTYSQRIPFIHFHFSGKTNQCNIGIRSLYGPSKKKNKKRDHIWRKEIGGWEVYLLQSYGFHSWTPEPGGCGFSMVIVGLPVEVSGSKKSESAWNHAGKLGKLGSFRETFDWPNESYHSLTMFNWYLAP